MSLPTAFVSERGTFPYRFAEAFLALGPQSIGVTGDNTLPDLIGRVWLLVLTSGRELHLYQRAADAPTWSRVMALLPPVFAEVQPAGRRRFSIAFDQSARANVAYEESGTIYLTRWDTSANDGAGGYVQNVTVAGVDPVVVFDATWAYDVTVSDVLLFYLDAATRSTLQCRVQRDLYLTEYELHDYGQSVVLDRVTRLPLQYQVLASDAIGEPLVDEIGRVGLLSALYPYTWREIAVVSASPATAGLYTLVILAVEYDDGIATMTAGPTGGILAEPIILYDSLITGELPEQIDIAVTGATGGTRVFVLIESVPDSEDMEATAFPPMAGNYVLVIIATAPPRDDVDVVASGPTGGAYVAA